MFDSWNNENLDIVLIRGIMSSSEHWWNFIPTLSDYFPKSNIETPDILGNGKMHLRKTPLSPQKNIAALRNQLKNKNRKILIGFSLGGMLAVEWAFLHPEEVAGIVLINSSLTGSVIAKRFRPKSFFKVLMMGLERNPYERENKILDITTRLLGEKKHEVINGFSLIEQKHPTQPLNFIRQLLVARQVTMFRDKPNCPIFILNSTQDQVVHHHCSHMIANKWNLELKAHPEAGHDLTLDDPHWVAKELRMWFKQQGWLKVAPISADFAPEYILNRPSLHP